MTLRRWYLGIAAAAAAAMPLGANAMPQLTTGAGPLGVQLKFNGVTVENAGTVGIDPTTGLPTANGGSCNLGGTICNETTWGVGTVAQSLNAATNVPIWNAGDGGQTLGFILSGIADQSITANPPNVNVDNKGATTLGASGVGSVPQPFGPGNNAINIQLYTFSTANTPCFSSGCSATNEIDPTSRLANNGSGLAVVTGMNSGPNAGTLFADIELVPGINPLDPNETLSQTDTAGTLPATGSGSFYADCITGPGCSEFSLASFGSVLADFFGQFDLVDNTSSRCTPIQCAEGKDGWPGGISDPIEAFPPVPEPASIAILGSALTLLGGVATRRRRRKGIST